MFKLGKLDPKRHPDTLLLDSYLSNSALPPPPEKRAWEYRVSDAIWASSMLGNDEAGCCVEAAAMHWIMAATANTKKPATFTKQNCLDLYSAITGYDSNDPSTDQGTAYTDLFAHWKNVGIKDASGKVHKILGWASIGLDLTKLRQAIDIFGGILIGTIVTQSMEEQFRSGEPWDAPFSGSVLGGHGIPWLGFGRQGQTCITWAKRQQMDTTAPSQIDEAYAVVTQDFVDDKTGLAPNALNMDALMAALKTVAV